MIKTYTGDLMMTVYELEKENNKVLDAWGHIYLGFYIKHFINLANKQHTLLWDRMLEVDMKETTEDKIKAMQILLDDLLK